MEGLEPAPRSWGCFRAASESPEAWSLRSHLRHVDSWTRQPGLAHTADSWTPSLSFLCACLCQAFPTQLPGTASIVSCSSFFLSLFF